MTDARQHLILLVSTPLMRDLPSDTEQRLHQLYVYGEKYEEATQPFDDICLHLSSLIMTQCTELVIYFRRSKENGLAPLFVQENIDRNKVHIDQLRDVCDNIDENIALSQEEQS